MQYLFDTSTLFVENKDSDYNFSDVIKVVTLVVCSVVYNHMYK